MGFYLDSSVPASGRTLKTSYPRSAGVRPGHRFYDPYLGRWLSRDPIAEAAALRQFMVGKTYQETRQIARMSRAAQKELYSFVRNDPINLVDPTGRSPLGMGIGIGVGIGIGIGVDMICCRYHIRDVLQEEERWAEGVTGIPHRDTPGSTTDALLHCSAGCRLTESPGSCIWASRAMSILNGRESGGSRDDRIDLGNNNEGHRLGATASSAADCRSACQKALAAGQLWTYDPNNPDNVIQLLGSDFPSYDREQ
jgi:hypothetical protein